LEDLILKCPYYSTWPIGTMQSLSRPPTFTKIEKQH
jgi:hypothetical protein